MGPQALKWVTAETARAELAGKNLACWCHVGNLCHADVLLRVANTAGESR